MFLTQLPLEHFHLSPWLPEKWDSRRLDRQICTFTPALTLENLPGFFQEKNPHLLFQVREGKDHSSPSALAVFLGLSPLQCSFLGLHKLHPYHPSLICALGSTRGASVTPLHLGTGSTSCFPCHTLVVGIL